MLSFRVGFFPLPHIRPDQRRILVHGMGVAPIRPYKDSAPTVGSGLGRSRSGRGAPEAGSASWSREGGMGRMRVGAGAAGPDHRGKVPMGAAAWATPFYSSLPFAEGTARLREHRRAKRHVLGPDNNEFGGGGGSRHTRGKNRTPRLLRLRNGQDATPNGPRTRDVRKPHRGRSSELPSGVLGSRTGIAAVVPFGGGVLVVGAGSKWQDNGGRVVFERGVGGALGTSGGLNAVARSGRGVAVGDPRRGAGLTGRPQRRKRSCWGGAADNRIGNTSPPRSFEYAAPRRFRRQRARDRTGRGRAGYGRFDEMVINLRGWPHAGRGALLFPFVDRTCPDLSAGRGGQDLRQMTSAREGLPFA